MKKVLVLILLTLMLTGCTKTTRNVQLTVINESTSIVTNVRAVGVGFSASIDILQAGEEASVTHVRPSAGADFLLNYDVDGKHFSDQVADNPWNGFKEIIVTIGPDFSTTYAFVTNF